MTHQLSVHLLLVVGIGAMAPACSRAQQEAPPEQKANSAPAAAETKAAPVPQRVVVNGCLQEGTRGSYIVTELSEPAHPDSSKPGVIAQERREAAARAYRVLSVHDTDLSKLVGKQVRVEGTEIRTSDLVPPAAPDGQAKNRTDANAKDRIKIEDLATVQADSIESLAKSCGKSSPRKGRSKRV